VTAPFFYLTTRSLKNRVWKRLRRLREPRYLLGLIAGLAYLYTFVIRNQMRASNRTAVDLVRLTPYVNDIVAGGAVLLWAGLVLVWLWPFPSQPWTFSAAEVQFFFTAPVTRRRLLNYKLLRSQTGVLFAVLMIAFFSGAARAATAGRWSFLLGGWLFFAIIQMHVRGALLTKLAFRAPTSKVPVLAWASSAVVVILSGLLLGALGVHARSLLAQSTSGVVRTVLDLAQGGVVSAVLWPFSAIVRPIFAMTPAAFLAALAPALAVLALHYWWVIGSDASLEEAATAAERRQAKARGAAPTPTALPVPFKLAAHGGPEMAILWKNTILLGRYFSVALLVRVLIPIVVLAGVVGLQSRGSKLAPLFAMVVTFMTLVGPYMVRNDLRHDMPRLPVLKTWPVSGRQLLVGELLAPAVALTVLVWFVLALAVALWPPSQSGPLNVVGRLAVAAGAAVVAPLLITGQLLIQNAAVVLFPGWIATGGARARGIEAMGQNMLMFAGTLLALAIGLLPAAAVSGGLGYLLYLAVGWAAVLPAAIAMAGILGGEAYLVVGWLGRLLERTDPAQVEAAE
jgi:ABC-2 type transport system permease protein